MLKLIVQNDGNGSILNVVNEILYKFTKLEKKLSNNY